jgi:restriction system protein
LANKKGWMVRAGEGGRLFEDFEKGYIAVGWNKLGDIANLNSRDKINNAYSEAYPDQKPSKRHNAAAMLHKFRNVMAIGDIAITYDPQSRQYLVGEVAGDYEYSPAQVGDYPLVRKMRWLGKVARDALKPKARNSLGSTLTLFALRDFVIDELLAVIEGRQLELAADDDESDEELNETKEDTVNRSKELIKDRIISLDAEEMEQLVAAVFRGMGFRARVSPRGPDRGVDVLASPDGLGLQEPRIKAEVKHRSGSMGSQSIRSFIGALRPGDRGVYVSTGGFSREARYEADRANIPITLVDIDELANLVVDYYEDFDLEGKALIPLVRIYWPAE